MSYVKVSGKEFPVTEKMIERALGKVERYQKHTGTISIGSLTTIAISSIKGDLAEYGKIAGIPVKIKDKAGNLSSNPALIQPFMDMYKWLEDVVEQQFITPKRLAA